MVDISLSDGLHLKKLDLLNQKDAWLAQELDRDELICGESGYLYSIQNLVNEKRYRNRSYLSSEEIYESPYALYYEEEPVGFMEISKIFEDLKMVDISYAILQRCRGNGYASRALREVSRQILLDKLNDIRMVSLVIDPMNYGSQAVARRAGFVEDGLSHEQHESQGYVGYLKTKVMVSRENNFY